jgi:hypothetical protein
MQTISQMQTIFKKPYLSKLTHYSGFLTRIKDECPQKNVPVAGPRVTSKMSRAIQTLILRLQREQNVPQSQGKLHLAKTRKNMNNKVVKVEKLTMRS